MSIKKHGTRSSLAARVRAERESRGWTLSALAERAEVSKAMISKIERGEVSPTAELLGRLSGAFGLTLSTLLARAEMAGGTLLRAADQAAWKDPGTGYVRRHVSPVSNSPLELISVELPAGESVSYPATAYTFIKQLVWILRGRLTFIEGETVHQLSRGDCLELGPPAPCTFSNSTRSTCAYLVVLLRN